MRKKGIWVVVSVLVVLGLLLGGFGCKAPTPTPVEPTPTPAPSPAAPEVTTWRGQISFTAAPAHGKIPRTGYGLAGYNWGEWIEEATDGQLVIDWAPPASIFPVSETLHAVSEGVVPIAQCWGNYYAGTMPEAGIASWLPFQAENLDDMFVIMEYYGLKAELEAAYDEWNIHYIPTYAGNQYNGWGANFPLTGPEAFQDKVIRGPGTYADIIAMLGASPVPLPWGEMYMGMKLGTIDGWMGGISALDEVNMSEVTQYYTAKPSHGLSYLSLLINKDVWNALPADIQELIERDSSSVLVLAGLQETTAERWLLANTPGVTFNYWSDEDVAKVRKQAIEEIWSKYAALSPRCGRIIDIFTQFQIDYGRL